MGNFAKKKIKLLNTNNIINNSIRVINSVHPSPLSANRGFFNSNIFKKCNEFYILQNNLKKLFFIMNNYKLNISIIKHIFSFINIKKICWNI